MGGAHAHRAGDLDVEVRRTPRLVLLGALVVAALATVVGVGLLWPDGDRVDALADDLPFAAPGVSFPTAEVIALDEPCPAGEPTPDCGQAQVRVTDGADADREVSIGLPPEVAARVLEVGDEVRLIRTPPPAGAPADAEPSFGYFGTVRTTPIVLLLAAFVLVVLVVARLRGLMALVGLAFAGVVLALFVLPALVSGGSPTWVGMVGSAAIMFVVLYTTHGFSLRTSAALAGTLAGIAATAVIGALAVSGARLSGVADQGGQTLLAFAPDLSFPDLFACAIIVAGLGVLNDVTITQASAVWEIRAASPAMSRRRVFTSGMRIGRDHIASTIYTIVFAYAGTALVVLLVLRLYQLPVLDLLATEEIGQEVVRTLATSIGLVLAVPLTTLIAVATLPPGSDEERAL